MKNKLKISVTGPLSEVNFGDYAMFINNFYDMEVDEITIFSYNKGFSQKIVSDYLSDKSISNIEVKLKEYGPVKKHEIQQQVGFIPFNEPTETPIDILNQVENYEEIKQAIKQTDVMVVNGGGYFNHLWNNSLWRSDMLKKIIAPILIANQLNKKIYFTGNGFGPFDQSEEFFNYIFNYLKNTTFGIRDRMYSGGYLKKIGINSEVIEFVPDDLFFINKHILNMPLNDSNILNVEKYILMELYFSMDEIEEYYEYIKQFSEYIFINYGLSIIFVPFDFERGGEWQANYLQERLENFFVYDLHKKGYLPIQDIYDLIKNAELVICNRYHALVLAISTGTPVVNIIKKVLDDYRYYYNKNFGLLEYAFDGIIFNELDFIKLDVKETLDNILVDYESIIKNQLQLFNTNEYRKNKEVLHEIRKEYLSKIQKGI